jgi:putative ATPase
LSEFVGQGSALRDGSPLRRLLDAVATQGALPSVILWGPPGTGKTTLAHLIARAGKAKFVEISALTAGVKDVREIVAAAQERRDIYGTQTVLFVDEVHRFNKTQQDALLPGVEHGWVTLVGATTENPAFSVNSALLSRSILVTLHSLDDDAIAQVLSRAMSASSGFNNEYEISPAATDFIVRLSGGDARRALTILEAAVAVGASDGVNTIEVDHVQRTSDQAFVRYDRDGDQHYDIISAYIKSVRGSDVDAALHYLARMIEAGEDPRFIARRLIILASEDIGLADNSMLNLAVSAAQSVALIGMPEGRITLAHATIALALAPKSNSAYVAIDSALADLRAGRIGDVPAHLRDSHYARAGALGHGVDYQYPHDLAEGVAAQGYLPDALANRRYWTPAGRGAEANLSVLWSKLRELLGRK